MKHVYQLDENDIIQVLANYYNCDRKDVTLTINHVCAGTDPSGHLDHKVEAEVKVKEK